jgi:hypothetical protein
MAQATLMPPFAVLPAGSQTASLGLTNVLYEKKGAIAYVTVNRPKVLNALNMERSANSVRSCAGRLCRTRGCPHRRRRQGVHRWGRYQRARPCCGVRSGAV